MTNDDDRMSLLATMYDSEDGPSAAPATPQMPFHPTTAMNMVQMSAYVRRLERTVEEQGRALRRLEGEVRRLVHALGNVRREVSAELDQKIDRRDF